MRATLRKSELLRGKENFQQVFEKGKKLTGKHIRCFILEGRISEPLQQSPVVGFVVRRTISRAVDRNRIKRLLRESYRKNNAILQSAMNTPTGALSIVFMYAPQLPVPVQTLTLSAIEHEMKIILTSIAKDYLS